MICNTFVTFLNIKFTDYARSWFTTHIFDTYLCNTVTTTKVVSQKHDLIPISFPWLIKLSGIRIKFGAYSSLIINLLNGSTWSPTI